jgi:hypothetical protein
MHVWTGPQQQCARSSVFPTQLMHVVRNALHFYGFLRSLPRLNKKWLVIKGFSDFAAKSLRCRDREQ